MKPHEDKLHLIDQRLEELIPAQPDQPHAALFSAARYSIFSKGKRLRPLLALITTESLGGSIAAALTPACALELIHTYSLIHDDLPCMDDDAFRRGQPSLHMAFNEGHAILTGDFLLTFAFEALSSAPLLSSKQKILLIRSLSQHAGANGMIGGQLGDLSMSPEIEWESLRWIHERKTGALFAAALECGGIVAKVDTDDLLILQKAGIAFGIAFQIFDDLADGPSDKESPSAISTLGAEKAALLAKQFLEQASHHLNSLSPPPENLLQLFIHKLLEESGK